MKSDHIVSALRDAYGPPEWAIMFEVSEGTGAMGGKRRADAVAMNMWPSRGMEIMGLEIKVTRQDLMRELRNPKKAEEVARYCDTWCLVTPVGLVGEDDALPMSWGLIEVDERGRLKTKVKPLHNDSTMRVTKTFMASCLRGVGRISDPEMTARMESERRRMREHYDADVERAATRITKGSTAMAELRQDLINIIGEEDMQMLRDEAFVGAVRAVYNSGITGTWSGLKSIEQRLRSLGDDLLGSAQRVGEQTREFGLTPRKRTRGK